MDTSIIKHVTISKLWGIKTISTDFDEHVNIFIGINGSSKTTFLNLIEATLLVDLKMFYSIDFEYIKIDFNSTIVQSILVTKQEKEGEFFISYCFDNEDPINIPCSELMIQRPYRMQIRYKESYAIVKERMKNLVNISWLSVNRDNSDLNEYDRHELERYNNMVDIKLQELAHNLVLYQLQLESEANKLADKFKENVLSLMLYDENSDYFKSDEITRYSSVDTKAMQADLFKAFNALGVAKDKSAAIQNHVKKIKGVVDNINRDGKLSIDEAFVLALINRTFSIIDISKTHETQKKEIFAQIEKLVSCLHRFMPDKEFILNKNNEGRVEVILKEGMSKDISFGLSSLSSGEKQLFILITESLLQKGIPHLFIADEPELSLHIGWQKLIIGELLEMNPNAQIIVATHSPEIAGNYPNNVVNMKKITSYHEQY
ncbi:MAG: AAA family ATPase [Bacteroidales bacterium]|nr:AAA family ATPase [Bacteroidales bacterium]